MNAEITYLNAKVAELERELMFYRQYKDTMLFPFSVGPEVIDQPAPLPPILQVYNVATLAIKEDDMEVTLIARATGPYQVGYYTSHKDSGKKRFVEIYDLLERRMTAMVVSRELNKK